jgi:formate dehydrogenase major subunit
VPDELIGAGLPPPVSVLSSSVGADGKLTLSWLSELQPELFCEVSPELAAELGLEHAGWATIRTARAEIESRVLVTRRIRPLVIGGSVVHQIALPYHFGRIGRVRGDVVNDLFELVTDPNVHIPESKVTTANIVPGRRSRGRTAAVDGPGAIAGTDPGPYALLARDLPNIGQKSAQPKQVKQEK